MQGLEKVAMGDQGHAAQQCDAEQEFSFREVIRRLWVCRALLFVLPAFAIGFGFFVLSAGRALDQGIVSYHVKLIGVEAGTYPNGTAFSPNDLKSTAVLTSLSDKFEVPASSLEAAISVSYDNPASDGIALKYQRKLSSRNLTPAEIDSINAAYTDELTAAVTSGLRVEVNNNRLAFSSEDAQALALAIPSTWNEIYLKRYRVLADTRLTEGAVSAIPEALTGTARLIVAGDHLDTIEFGLRLISEDNRLAGLTTPEGLTADDLRNQLREFRAAYFDPLIAGGFASSDPVAVAQKKRLELSTADLKRQIEGLDQNLAQLLGERSTSTAEFASQGANLEQGALETIMALVRRSSHILYTQELLDKRQKLIEQHSNMRSRLEAVTFHSGSSDIALSTGLTPAAETRLEALSAKYRTLFSAAQQQLTQSSGRFYAEASTTTTKPEYFSLRNSRVLMIFAIGGILAALAYALLVPSIRSAVGTKKAKTTMPIRMVANG